MEDLDNSEKYLACLIFLTKTKVQAFWVLLVEINIGMKFCDLSKVFGMV